MTRVDFFARIARLERESGRALGGPSPSGEPVRFVPSVAMSFAASDVEIGKGADTEIVTHFLGIAGGDGALPPYLADDIANEDPERPVRRALLTPLHHRAISLLHRSVHRCRVPEESERLSDPWPSRLAHLARGDVTSDTFERGLALLVAPLLLAPPSACSLDRALRVVASRWLGDAPIALAERSGGRAPIHDAARSRLGRTRLGDDAMLGGSVDDATGRASIVVGPIEADAHDLSNPEGFARRAIELLARWLGDPLTTLDLVIVQRAEPARLGRGRLGSGTLGRATPRRRLVHLHATPTHRGRELTQPRTTLDATSG